MLPAGKAPIRTTGTSASHQATLLDPEENVRHPSRDQGAAGPASHAGRKSRRPVGRSEDAGVRISAAWTSRYHDDADVRAGRVTDRRDDADDGGAVRETPRENCSRSSARFQALHYEMSQWRARSHGEPGRRARFEFLYLPGVDDVEDVIVSSGRPPGELAHFPTGSSVRGARDHRRAASVERFKSCVDRRTASAGSRPRMNRYYDRAHVDPRLVAAGSRRLDRDIASTCRPRWDVGLRRRGERPRTSGAPKG